jgi:nucleotide-binding universal stress UspA family protein
VEGEAPEEIVRVARLGGHDLIVMSTHGSGAIRRWLLVGSVTTKVLHSSDCAVLAATDFSARTAEIRNVVCAVDMGPESRRVLCGSAGLARELGARLTVVHAVPGLRRKPRTISRIVNGEPLSRCVSAPSSPGFMTAKW